MADSGQQSTGMRASLAVVLAGATWGLFWLPLRLMDENGLSGAWASLGFYLAALPIVIPLALYRWRQLLTAGPGFYITTAFTGLAFTCYATSLLLTDVVRALLLFYITPVWGTLLAWLLMGEPLTRPRIAALILAGAGLVTILGVGSSSGQPPTTVSMIGDALGLIAGIAWAYGTLRIYRKPEAGGLEQSLGLFGWAAVYAVLFLLVLPDAVVQPVPTREALLDNALFAMATSGGVYLITAWVILWAAMHLDPGRVGILLMGEIVIGVVSAAILTDEAFGLREALGTFFILSAAIIEVMPSRPKASQTTS